MKLWYVYLCGEKGYIYTAMTTDLSNRMRQHHAELLYSESYSDKYAAAKREKEITGWRREKKLALISGSKVSLS